MENKTYKGWLLNTIEQKKTILAKEFRLGRRRRRDVLTIQIIAYEDALKSFIRLEKKPKEAEKW